jgi:hypothetical protein
MSVQSEDDGVNQWYRDGETADVDYQETLASSWDTVGENENPNEYDDEI